MIDLLIIVSLTLAWLLIKSEVALRDSRSEVARLRAANELLSERIKALERTPQGGSADYQQ